MTNDALARLSRRHLLSVGAGAGVLGALVACAPREGPQTPAGQPKATSRADFGGATEWRRFEGTTISLLLCEHWWTKPISKRFSEFEALTGIKIKANTLSEDSYFQQALVTLSSGASTYDGIMVGNLQAGQYMNAGWLTPLDQYFTSGDLIDGDWFDTPDFFEASRKAGTKGEELLALPISAEAGVVMYRSSLLSKAGVKKFATQQDILDAAKAVQSKKMPRPFVGRGRRGLDIVWAWTNYFLTEGGEFFDGNTPTVNSDAGVRATELYVEDLLAQYGPTGASNMSWLEATGQVNEGDAAIYTDASGLLSVVLDSTQSDFTDDIGVQRWPTSESGGKASPNYWYWLAGIPSGSANKEAAALFYAWAMGPETALAVSAQAGSPSARRSVWDDKEFRSFYPGDTATEITENLAAVATERVPYDRATFPKQADALGLQLVKVLSDRKNIRTALADAAKAMQAEA